MNQTMKAILRLIAVICGIALLAVSCNKDKMNSRTLIGDWKFSHHEITMKSGSIVTEKLEEGTVIWSFTDQLVTFNESSSYGDESSTYSYVYDKGLLIIDTWHKTFISETPHFKVEKLTKTEMRLDAYEDIYSGSDEVKWVLVFKRK